jgi:pyruvate/2-oxoacid:ferredoxin oxidoreductase beta subunit
VDLLDLGSVRGREGDVAPPARLFSGAERNRLVVVPAVAAAESERLGSFVHEPEAERSERSPVERPAWLEIGDRNVDVIDRHGASPIIEAVATNGKLTAKDYKTDQEVRWCPGCGDYAILAALQSFMPELDIPKEKIVFVSGIGCAARFPYYMETYGMHSIHGRAPAIATGLATSRPDLAVWVVTGDGDALSIGGNHLIHALRRNVNIKILLFNNEIYGLTKGQYSPTSPLGTRTKSTPMGSLDWPFNPLSLAIGAEASFVARGIDTDRAHLTEVLRAAASHRGSAFVEIFQNCNIYNDGAFDFVRDDKTNRIYLEHGTPIRFGEDREKGVRQRADGSVEVVEVSDEAELLVHDAHHEQPSAAFALSRLTQSSAGATPIGVFRDVERPVYDDLMSEQLEVARAKQEGDLATLLHAGDTWKL